MAAGLNSGRSDTNHQKVKKCTLLLSV